MKTLIVVQGPTGVGKTELSLSLAELFKSPIINADSRQIYREIPIGTAAPTIEEQKRVKHYFVGSLSLTDYYSAAKYEQDVLSLCNQLFQERDVLVLSGGSMMYIDAVCKGIDDIPTVDADTRKFVLEKYEVEGLENLAAQLRILDPEYYAICDQKNVKRVLHALEICLMTGKTYTSFRTRQTAPRPFQIIKIGLHREREELYERINARAGIMMDKGWLEEARSVYPLKNLNSLNTVGYKELFNFFDGEWTLDFALEKIRRNTRVYSRKQMTWLRKDDQINWFRPEDFLQIRKFIISIVDGNN